MKNYSSIIIMFLILFQSCKLANQNADEEEILTDSKETFKAIDKDENGCLASAGYIWSKLNKECVKLFTGVQLNPANKLQNEDEVVSAYLLFSEDANKAELFLPNATSSLILVRENESKPWVFEEWELIAKNGYILKKENKTQFIGEDFIGKKILESDNQ